MTSLLYDDDVMPDAHGGVDLGSNEAAAEPKGSIEATMVGFVARGALQSQASRRSRARAVIINILSGTSDPEPCIDELLQVCTAEGGSDGLDVAIDILSKLGSQTLEYARNYLIRDLRNWGPSSDRAYEPNDDYWYILLCAVGRSQVSEADRFRFITCCSNATSRGIREGVVVGLRELGTEAAKKRLRHYASDDRDGFIRKIASEALEELEG